MEVTTGAMLAGGADLQQQQQQHQLNLSQQQHHQQLLLSSQQQHAASLYHSSSSSSAVAVQQQQVAAPPPNHSGNSLSSSPAAAALPPISSFKPALQQKDAAAAIGGRPVVSMMPQETAETLVNFFELYKELGKENYAKMTTCSYCGRRFRFASVLLEHLPCHVGAAAVEKIVEMRMKIWVKRGSLKCGRAECCGGAAKQQKFAYTLDYVQHRDGHEYAGLACAVCGSVQGSPARYAAHLRAEHEAYLYLTDTQAEDIPAASLSSPATMTAAAAVVAATDVDVTSSHPTGLSSGLLNPSPMNGSAAHAGDESTAAVCGSPQMYHSRSVGPPPALHMTDVKTPQSAPPVLAAFSPIPPSPLGVGGGGGLSVHQQQPMSAPSLYNNNGDDGLDYGGGDIVHHHHMDAQQQQQSGGGSMPSMPCLVGGEEEDNNDRAALGAAVPQNPPAPDVNEQEQQQQQRDSEDIMDILKDIEALGETLPVGWSRNYESS
jgi:hypothetical protein